MQSPYDRDRLNVFLLDSPRLQSEISEGGQKARFWNKEERNHVLWDDRMGSLAHSGADRLPPVPLLSHPRVLHGPSRGDASILDESHVFLRLMLVASTVTGWCAIVSFILSSLAG
ncbi:hypothetical protein ZIOFF_057205 [Zingiber officinale]|uniref:Uncharacterized protein n=1 Tax=Zingiber officinale TaxID=94328 RepID=A0A8J5F666_ZINOF|nr:hypothetical protein ZIOFF_057205 [Zingiber officinale]